MSRGRRVLIAGIGNLFRSDDAAGPVAARRLRDRVPACVSVIEDAGDPVSLIDAWKGADAVILIDSVSSGAPPGTIHRFEAGVKRKAPPALPSSTHAFGLPDVIELARALGKLPPSLIVYGIEGKTFEAGEELSAEVMQSINEVVARVEQEAGVE